MPIDREDTLKKAEKLLRQGKLEAAIAEYLRVAEEQPGDWATANTLGDLYVRAGQPDMAAAQYNRVAEHFVDEGFYPKASAIYKKLLKLRPEDEAIQLSLAEMCQRQGLLADAKAQLNAVAARRRNRGDRAGAAEIVLRLGAVDPADFDARTRAAKVMAEMGDEEKAAAAFRALHADLLEKGRDAEALDALRQAVAMDPHDRDARIILARTAVEAGDIDGARQHLDRETAAGDPALQLALLDLELRSGRLEDARDLTQMLVDAGDDHRQRVVDLAWTLVDTSPEASFILVDRAVEAAGRAGHYGDAAALLQEFAARVPNQVPALQKLIEVCVDGGLEATMYEAQAQLADAYLGAGQASEARVIAEDLVAREPWESAHIDRFRRALVMLKVSDPDTLIAERLSGQAPFTATDVFADVPSPAAPAPIPLTSFAPEPDDIEVTPESFAAAAPAEEAPSPHDEEGEQRGPAPEEIDITGVLDSRDAARSPKRPEAEAASEAPGPQLESGRVPSGDQSAQHMTLARTYLEMGLPDQAISSLEVACRAPRFRFEAASALGRLYRDRGELAPAIEWLERAAEAPAPTIDESRAVLYDLGALVEESGDTARALAIFLELQSEAGTYRDVADHVERLARVETGG